MYTILVLEDDVELNQTITYALKKEGYHIFSAHSCKEAEKFTENESFHLTILDVNLPDGDGFQFCKWLKAKKQVPVLFVSARDLEEDILNGYELGADDYVTKPFSMKILLKKVYVILTRKSQGANIYDDGFLKVNFELGTVRQKENECLLSPTEYRILKKLIENKGKLLTYSILLDSLWDEGVQITDKHTLAVNINRLRKKIETEEHSYISNVYGMGVHMETMIFIIFFALVFIATFILWKYIHLKHDVYEYTEKLDIAINKMLKNEELKTSSYKQDDLWGKIYNRLVRLSHLYTHKNLEISEEKNKLKELVSDISHQTKTPIANIKLYLEMMTDETDFDKNQEYLKKMNGQVDKLDFLLQSMVKMSRLETGTIKIQKQKTPLANTLAMAISNMIIKAEKKNITIDVQYDERLELNHDKKWTAEAIFNILDNAVKYTNDGGNIHIVVYKQELFTKISIEDTGKGIIPERQATIFTRFYREPEVHDNDGIGIGLYLAREIIMLQNGYIEVHSKIGKGSTFMIYLPNRD